MQLTEIGKLAETYWMEIPEHFSFVTLGNFVIMPNHMHGILIIDRSISDDKVKTRLVKTLLIASPQVGSPHTEVPQSQQAGGITGNKNPMLHENIARIIRWYKGRCTYEIRKINSAFAWQSLFHDHIIRNAKAFDNIQNYIANNPSKWDEDTFFERRD
ncbi:hypothetical protein [Tenacibaculum halocynthiae]|uniref:hypothetical protein n=1 Tax=Tenacibaculum halocynthiae TaxID=1254437 RepID=UPI003D6485E8